MSRSICSSDSSFAESSSSTEVPLGSAEFPSNSDQVPPPCFSHIDFEVENAAYLGFEAAFQECCKEEGRMVDKVRWEHLINGFESERGSAREKDFNDSILKSGDVQW